MIKKLNQLQINYLQNQEDPDAKIWLYSTSPMFRQTGRTTALAFKYLAIGVDAAISGKRLSHIQDNVVRDHFDLKDQHQKLIRMIRNIMDEMNITGLFDISSIGLITVKEPQSDVEDNYMRTDVYKYIMTGKLF